MEGKFHLYLLVVEQSAEQIQSVWGGMAQLQNVENNTFNHLGETGTEMKLITFQKKSSPPKSSILAPIFVLWKKGAGDCSHTSSLQNHF
jgi:hypothetical protein